MPPKSRHQPKPQPGDKRKWTPRPARPASERLPKLYRALADQVNDGYFDNAKKTCRKSESPSVAECQRDASAWQHFRMSGTCQTSVRIAGWWKAA